MNVALQDPTTPHGVQLTVEDFLLLSDNGAFDAYSKSELIQGEIFCVNSQFARHARAKSQMFAALDALLKQSGSSLQALVEVAVQLDENTLVEPDIVLTSYQGDGIVPADTVLLAIEVADTTLQYDLRRKAPLYAAAGVPECWVADLTGGELHQLWSPVQIGYANGREVPLTGRIEAVTLPDIAIIC